ncbi:MAG: hypothetical protein AAF236_12930, partial [Verrucomicrobiota bacterium]
MNWLKQVTDNEQAEIDAPPKASLKIFRLLFVVFLFSFVFDYKSPSLGFGAASTGGSKAQFLFLGLAMASGGLASLLGFRHLFIRPGVYLGLMWWGYVAMAIGVSFFLGNEPGRILRLLIPMLLVGFAFNCTMICSAVGMRPGEVARWFLLAGITNVLWRFVFGATAWGIPLSEIRMDILSPSMRFLFAWSACAFLLRLKFTPWSLIIFGLPLGIAAISVTRSMAFPVFFSFLTAGICLLLGMVWRMYAPTFPLKKIQPLVGMGIAMVFVIIGVAMVQPTLATRWYDRFFNNTGVGDAQTSEDLSSLMRKAEAKSMWDILSKDPHSMIYGKGLGAPYYWDESYYPELFLVYPNDRHQFPFEIYSAGHSIWTYTLFSTGWIGIALTLAAFFVPMLFSLWAAYLNSKTVMGPRAWDSFLVWLPFVAMWATLSESITRNPFDERFTGV